MEPPFAITGIDHIVLRVVDLGRMLTFYRDILGCTIDREQAKLGLTQLRAGRSLIDLVTISGELGRRGGAAPGPEGRNCDHFCLGVRPFDPDRLAAYLAARGIAIVESGPRYGAEGEGPSIYVRDPEGNVVELKSVGTDASRLEAPERP
jgi:catechol 2,3-dioxygenase-like lactoylglutathione lyase family enzyme